MLTSCVIAFKLIKYEFIFCVKEITEKTIHSCHLKKLRKKTDYTRTCDKCYVIPGAKIPQ